MLCRRTRLIPRDCLHLCSHDTLSQDRRTSTLVSEDWKSTLVRSKPLLILSAGFGLVASTVATTNGVNECHAATIARLAGGLLAVHGIQS
jgi:hypothetical protein